MTDEENTARQERLDDFLTQEFGPHGAWVLVLERYDADLAPVLQVDVQHQATDWTAAGLTMAASDMLRDSTREGWQD